MTSNLGNLGILDATETEAVYRREQLIEDFRRAGGHRRQAAGQHRRWLHRTGH